MAWTFQRKQRSKRGKNRTESKQAHIMRSNRETELYCARVDAERERQGQVARRQARSAAPARSSFTHAPQPREPQRVPHVSAVAASLVPKSTELVDSAQVCRIGDLSIDFHGRAVKIGGRPIQLTPKEYSLLEYFGRHKGEVVTKDALFRHLYPGLEKPGLTVVDSFIGKVRTKLFDASRGDKYIDTVWGKGYILRDPAAVKDAAE